jgi:tetratricopeptide (TPR) repeat protein
MNPAKKKKEKRENIPAETQIHQPSPWFWIALLGIVIAGAFLFAFPIYDTDFFWHLEAGRIIHDTRSIPRTDPFSFIAEGRKWVTHEWLFELVTYLLYLLGSFKAICIARILIVLGAIVPPLLIYRKSPVSPVWIFLTGLLGLTILLSRADWRPLLMTILFFSIYLMILENYVEKGSNRLWILPVLMVIWANWHSGMLFGLLIVLFHAAIEFFSPASIKRKEARTPTWQTLALTLIVCALASLVNVNFLDAHFYPLRLGEFYSKVMLNANTIDELQTLTPDRIPAFWLSIIILAISLLLSKGKFNRRHLAILVLLAIASIYRQRLVELYTPALMVFGPGMIQPALDGLRERLSTPRSRILTAVASLAVFALLINISWNAMSGPPRPGVNTDAFPAGSSDWVEKFNPPGTMYNDLEFGGYLLYRFYPDRKIFWYGDLLLFEDIHRRLAQGAGLRDIANIDWAIMDRMLSGTSPYTPDQWALVAFDSVSSVYILRNGAASGLIDDHEYFLLAPFEPVDMLRNVRDASADMRDRLVRELERFVSENDTDYGRALAARCYLMLGEDYYSTAAQLLADGLERNPWHPNYWLASALYDFRTGRSDIAEKTLHSLLFWWPRFTEARFLLGLVQADRVEHRAAIRSYRRVLQEGYKSPAVYFALANSLHETGDNLGALRALENYFRNVSEFDRGSGEYSDAIELSRNLVGG